MTIREATLADAAGIARVQIESIQAAYIGLAPQEHLDALSIAEEEKVCQGMLSRAKEDGTSTLVAETERGIVGFISFGQEGGDASEHAAKIHKLFLLPAQQGRGLGRRLMTLAARRLHDAGYSTLFLWTYAHGPARGFYEALGGGVTRTRKNIIHGNEYDDVGYGWNAAALDRLVNQ